MKVHTTEDLILVLESFIKEEGRNFEGKITPDTHLIDEGVIDSLSFVKFTCFLEEKTGIPLDLSDFEITDFETPASLHVALSDIFNS